MPRPKAEALLSGSRDRVRRAFHARFLDFFSDSERRRDPRLHTRSFAFAAMPRRGIAAKAQFAVPDSCTRNGCVALGASCANSSVALRGPAVVSGLKRRRYCTKSPGVSRASSRQLELTRWRMMLAHTGWKKRSMLLMPAHRW